MLIPYSILPLGAALVLLAVLATTLLRSKKEVTLRNRTEGVAILSRKVLSVLVLAAFATGRLFRKDVIYGQLGLDAADARLPAAEMTPTALVFWFGLLTVSMTILAPFFEKRSLHDYVAILAPVSVVLSCLHLRQLYAITTGVADPWQWRNLLFVIELALTATVAFTELYVLLRDRVFGGGERRRGGQRTREDTGHHGGQLGVGKIGEVAADQDAADTGESAGNNDNEPQKNVGLKVFLEVCDKTGAGDETDGRDEKHQTDVLDDF